MGGVDKSQYKGGYYSLCKLANTLCLVTSKVHEDTNPAFLNTDHKPKGRWASEAESK